MPCWLSAILHFTARVDFSHLLVSDADEAGPAWLLGCMELASHGEKEKGQNTKGQKAPKYYWALGVGFALGETEEGTFFSFFPPIVQSQPHKAQECSKKGHFGMLWPL